MKDLDDCLFWVNVRLDKMTKSQGQIAKKQQDCFFDSCIYVRQGFITNWEIDQSWGIKVFQNMVGMEEWL